MSRASRVKFALQSNDGGAWGGDDPQDGAESTIVWRSTEIEPTGAWMADPEPALRYLAAAELSATRLAPGDLLVVKSSGSADHVGKTALVGLEQASGGFSNFLQRLRPAPGQNPRYLWYLLNSRLARAHYETVSTTTSGLRNLNRSLIGSVPLPLSQVERQRHVADFLDCECERIAELLRELDVVEEDAASLFAYEFARAVADTPRVRLKHLGYTITQGWSPEASAAAPSADELGVLRLSGVSTGTFRPDDAKALSPELGVLAAPYLLKDGDLLLVRASGSLRLLGQATLVTGIGKRRLIYPDLVYRLEPTSGSIPRPLVLQLLRTPIGQAALTEAKRGAANNKLRIEDVRNLVLPRPAMEDVARLLDLSEAWEVQQTMLKDELSKLQQLLTEYRDALVTEAVTGKLDVTRLSDQQLDESARAAIEGEQPEVLSA